MAKILMAVWPIETHLTPFVAVARALEARGHDVGFYTGGEMRQRLARDGFRSFPFQEAAPYTERNPGEANTGKMGWRARRQMWRDFLLGSVPGQLKDIEQIWKEWPPDAMVCDVTMWGPILVTQETKRVPLAVLSHTAYCLLTGRENPAPGVSMPRPRGAGMRLAARVLSAGMNMATATIPREANGIRRAYGLAPFDTTVLEFTGRMPLHLVQSARELDYDRNDLPSSVRYIGSCIGADEGQPAPEWVEGMRGQRSRIVVLEERPCDADHFLLQTAASAFAGHAAEVILVAERGRDVPAFDTGRAAANVRWVPWTPLTQAVRSADVVVAHGNSETVLATLSLGIPMVVVPRMLDQPQLAWRLAASGAGLRLPMRRATPERLRAAVERVLGGEIFGRQARRMGAALAQTGGPARAAEWIEGLESAACTHADTRRAAPIV